MSGQRGLENAGVDSGFGQGDGRAIDGGGDGLDRRRIRVLIQIGHAQEGGGAHGIGGASIGAAQARDEGRHRRRAQVARRDDEVAGRGIYDVLVAFLGRHGQRVISRVVDRLPGVFKGLVERAIVVGIDHGGADWRRGADIAVNAGSIDREFQVGDVVIPKRILDLDPQVNNATGIDAIGRYERATAIAHRLVVETDLLHAVAAVAIDIDDVDHGAGWQLDARWLARAVVIDLEARTGLGIAYHQFHRGVLRNRHATRECSAPGQRAGAGVVGRARQRDDAARTRAFIAQGRRDAGIARAVAQATDAADMGDDIDDATGGHRERLRHRDILAEADRNHRIASLVLEQQAVDLEIRLAARAGDVVAVELDDDVRQRRGSDQIALDVGAVGLGRAA